MSSQAVVIIFGGCSVEHAISCASARFVVDNLREMEVEMRVVGISKQNRWFQQNIAEFLDTPSVREGRPIPHGFYPNTTQFLIHLGLEPATQEIVLFPMVHGQQGEDGTLQGLFNLSRVAFVGSDVLGSALAFDKIIAKELVQSQGIDTVKSVSFSLHDWQVAPDTCRELMADTLELPVFVKPSRSGSSVGITKVEHNEQLNDAIDTAFNYDHHVLVEHGVEGIELECAVIGDREPRAAPHVGELTSLSGFYDYHTKYVDDSTMEIVVPARISPELCAEVQRKSERIFQILRLHGMARIDFLHDHRANRLYFSEANTVPGFTDISLFPVMWQKSGMDAAELINELLQFARARYARWQTRKLDFTFHQQSMENDSNA